MTSLSKAYLQSLVEAAYRIGYEDRLQQEGYNIAALQRGRGKVVNENADTVKYVYHFCSEWMTRARILQRFDGIADMSLRVLTLNDYREVKECIGKAAKDAPEDRTQITILSLSLLGEREVKGGKEP